MNALRAFMAAAAPQIKPNRGNSLAAVAKGHPAGADARVPRKLKQRSALSNHPYRSLAADARKQVKQQRQKKRVDKKI
jgi:hypothetical protein